MLSIKGLGRARQNALPWLSLHRSGAAMFPFQADMARGIDSYYNSITATLKRGSISSMGFRVLGRGNYKWMDKVAGIGCGRCGWPGGLPGSGSRHGGVPQGLARSS
ncbi:uncharacterized protein LY79DRAFT_571803 [Colletotrichum navitas]|uniref:Uncharacterized protein n=1 Tax=Colletotrichum navitas TaxID=681940 RepID=A0AAD8UZ61_9PEZI|nr:uncharacterized protein LY79DRAFT_571803 [Colletotrichum navitas]KAK1569479.1 hypothetical protein LY79DRAFT_571803 [Colletotrichum navitas]